MLRSRAWARRIVADDAGSAALEFLTAGTLMLVPLVYLVIALGQLQSHALGVEAGARFAARAIASGEGSPDAVLDSVTREYGIAAFDVSIACTPVATPCPAPGATVVVTVSTDVPLPLMSSVLGLDRLARVPVEAASAQRVSRFREPG